MTQSEPPAPWYVVSSDHKWYRRSAVAAVILDALHNGFPEPDGDHRELLAWGRRQLEVKG